MDLYKFKKIDYFALLIPVLFGGVSILLWLLEIIFMVGWGGIDWILCDLKSVYILTLFAVLSYVLPIVLFVKVKTIKVFFSVGILYGFSIVGFFVTKWILRQLFDKIGEDTHVFYVWLLILDTTVIAALFAGLAVTV